MKLNYINDFVETPSYAVFACQKKIIIYFVFCTNMTTEIFNMN